MKWKNLDNASLPVWKVSEYRVSSGTYFPIRAEYGDLQSNSSSRVIFESMPGFLVTILQFIPLRLDFLGSDFHVNFNAFQCFVAIQNTGKI